MSMSQINTFMSHVAVNQNAEGSEFERGTWLVVAWNQRGRSSNHFGTGTRPVAAASVPILAARPLPGSPRGSGWRTVRTGDVQDSGRCARTVASLFGQQRPDAERDCHPCDREVPDRGAAAPKTWLSDLESLLQFVWNSLSIACCPSSCNKCTQC